MMKSNQPKLEGEILRTVIQEKPNYQHCSQDHLVYFVTHQRTLAMVSLTESPSAARRGSPHRGFTRSPPGVRMADWRLVNHY